LEVNLLLLFLSCLFGSAQSVATSAVSVVKKREIAPSVDALFYSTVRGGLYFFAQEIEQDFNAQIRKAVVAGEESLCNMLAELPFEPDNLNTQDCTFSACCNVLLVNEVLTNTNSTNTEIFNLLSKIATLTYLRHSGDFIEKVFIPICNSLVSDKQNKTSVSQEKLATFYKNLSIDTEKDDFYRYKYECLSAMVKFVNEKMTRTKALIVLDAEQVPLKLKYMTRNDQDGQRELISFVQSQTKRWIIMKRFWDSIDDPEKCTIEFSQRVLGKTTKIEEHDVFYQKQLSTKQGITEIVVAARSQLFPDFGQNKDYYYPTLVLQTFEKYGVSKFLGKEEKGYPVHEFDRCSGWPDKELNETHAICSNLYTVVHKNTYFSGRKGLIPQLTSDAFKQAILKYRQESLKEKQSKEHKEMEVRHLSEKAQLAREHQDAQDFINSI
jgi:hypothetical protein